MTRFLVLLSLVACTGNAPYPLVKPDDTAVIVDDTALIVDDTGGGAAGWAFSLANSGGCGDTYLWATGADDAQAFTFALEGPVAAAFAAGAVQEVPIDLAAGGAQVFAIEGLALSSLQCNDTPPDGPIETSRVAVTAGVGTLTITPDLTVEPTPYNMPAQAELLLHALTFVDAEGHAQERAELAITASVGWFPG